MKRKEASKVKAFKPSSVWSQAVKAVRKEPKATGNVADDVKTRSMIEDMIAKLLEETGALPTGSPLDVMVPIVTYRG